jgi:L-ascorbate metabolism protein UlaG (beta-lactamase superfamily)
MQITYFGHSCFKFNENGYQMVIDPFKDVKGYNDVKTTADMVLCSHDHFDHNAVAGVKRKVSGVQNPFAVTMMKTYHDNEKGEKRGENNVHIISASGKTYVHLGDLGHVLNEKQVSYIKNCHCLMIPIGGTYTVNIEEAWQIINAVDPDIVIPMHYKNGKYGFDVLENLSDFLTKSNRKIAVTTEAGFFELPSNEKLIVVPAVFEE